MFNFLLIFLGLLVKILEIWFGRNLFFSFSRQSHAESSRSFVKNSAFDPKRAKLNQKSEIGHVRTCQDLSRRTSTYCKPAEILLFFQKLHLFHFLLINLYLFMKSCVLLSKFMFFYKIICFTKQIYRRQVVIAKPCFYF